MNLVRAGQSNILSCFVFHHTSKRSEPGRHGDPAAPSVSELSLKKWFLQWTVSELYLLLTWAVTWHYLLTRSDISSASVVSIQGAQTKLLAVTKFEIVLTECLNVSTECPGLREWEERRRLLHDFCLIVCQSAPASTLWNIVTFSD